MLEPLSHFDLHHRLEAETSPSLVVFGTTACASCRHLKSVLITMAQTHTEWRFFEVDAAIDLALTREFEVFHLPSLFLFTNGQFHAPIHAHASAQAIEAAIHSALAEPAQEAP